MKNLSLSKVFPKWHRSAAGFPTMFLQGAMSGRKRHTIRINEKGYWKDGDVVRLTQWSGKPYRSKMEKSGAVFRIGLEPVMLQLLEDGLLRATVERKEVFPGRLAHNDGLTLEQFIDWFFSDRKPGIIRGSILHFTSFRYGDNGHKKHEEAQK